MVFKYKINSEHDQGGAIYALQHPKANRSKTLEDHQEEHAGSGRDFNEQVEG